MFPQFFLLLLLLSVPNFSKASIVGLFVFPHGGIILDPHTRDFSKEAGNREGSREDAIRLHEGVLAASTALLQLKPDIIFLSTPHGFHLEHSYALVAAPRMKGDAGWEWSNYSASFEIAVDTSVSLYAHLRATGNPVELLSLGVGRTEMPLHWGEVIPWWFVSQAASNLSLPLPPVLYLGQPPAKNLKEETQLGKDIAGFLSKLGKRVVILVSGDLAHSHSNDPRAPYPFNRNAAVFDSLITKWAQAPRFKGEEESGKLLKEAYGVADAAGSCGYNALIMVHSMLSTIAQDGGRLNPVFWAAAAPTYFGMIVTSWIPT